MLSQAWVVGEKFATLTAPSFESVCGACAAVARAVAQPLCCCCSTLAASQRQNQRDSTHPRLDRGCDGRSDTGTHSRPVVDPATGWFETVQTPDKRADVIANLLEQRWLTRCPWPTQIVTGRGTEFMAEVKTVVRHD